MSIDVVIGNLNAKGDVNHDDEEGEKTCLFIFVIEAAVLCEFAIILRKL